MKDLGVALGWKYNDAEGIVTWDGVLTGWPVSLGAKPTIKEQEAIVAEYQLAMAAEAASEAADKERLQSLKAIAYVDWSAAELREMVYLLAKLIK